MSIVKSVLIVASLLVGASAANATSVEDLLSGYHGNTSVSGSYRR